MTTIRPGDSLAVVLSGGGAHGLAHIGVLEVLDSLGVRPALVVGTSMGALVGALYAGGLSGREIDSVTRRLPLEDLFRRYPPMTLVASGDLRSPVVTMSPAFVVEQIGASVRLQSPTARERQINTLLAELLLHPNILAAGDFARLPTPFVAMATDIRTRTPVILDRGDLAQAVRASASLPIIFAPIARGEQMLIDGGLSANVPLAAARERGIRRLIVSDVGTMDSQIGDVRSTTGMLGFLLNSLFDQGPYNLNDGDVAIRPDTTEYGLLNFSREAIGSFIAEGYKAGREALRDCTPLERQPQRRRGVTADERRIADRLTRLLDEGVYESIWLNPRRGNAATSGDSVLAFSPVAAIAPGRSAGVGLAYDNHNGIEASIASASTALLGGRLSANGAASIGEWRQQLLFVVTGRRRHPLRSPNGHAGGFTEILPDPRSDEPPWSMLTRDLLRPTVSLAGTHETMRLYDDAGHELARESAQDLVALAGATIAFSSGWQAVLGPIGQLWHEEPASATKNELATGGLLRVARLFPPRTTGPDQSSLPGLAGELVWTDHYWRGLATADLMTERYGFQLRTRGTIGAGQRLPLPAQLTLGGSLGFPGLMLDERRGDRAASLSVAVARVLLGPLHWRVEAGRGYTRLPDQTPPGVVPAQGWVSGADVGIASDTPLGPFVLSFGMATGSRRVVKFRVGG